MLKENVGASLEVFDRNSYIDHFQLHMKIYEINP
jgi:hypothetical protein